VFGVRFNFFSQAFNAVFELHGGRPTAFDRLLAARLRVTAVEQLMAGEHGVMVGLQGREINPIALADVCANKRRANLEYYRMARMLAK